MRDMIPPGERSIRNIPVSQSHRRATRAVQESPRERFDDGEDDIPRRPRRRFGRTFWLIGVGVVIVCIIGGLLLSTVFAGATVTIYPRTETIASPPTLEARLQAPAGVLVYQHMTMRSAATTTVAASGTTKVSRQASGVITVYNTYSTLTQRLIANTRFEAPDGKIYRIRDSVTVAGATKQTDGSLQAGTVMATVYADSPGADYNRPGTTRFTIPGFKGDPRYDKFYAQSQGGITGGFVGSEPSVPAAELAKAQAALKLELDSALRANAEADLPEGFILVPGTLAMQYADIVKMQNGNNATLSQSAMATAAIVRASDFAAALARSALGGSYGGEAVALKVPSELILTLATSSTLTDGVLRLSLSGSATLVWQFDPAAVKAALLGKDREALQEIISTFAPSIIRADATLRPFWQGSFPSDPGKIKVVVGEE